MNPNIRKCTDGDFDAIFEIVNDAAEAYRGIIPPDRWHDPYMPAEELRHEIDDGVVFWGFDGGDDLIGVMGLQDVRDVTLIRHAYVRSDRRRGGIGGILARELYAMTDRPTLVGTWAAADWAVRFYEKYGFRMVDTETKNRLLRTYWTIPERQVETSVVLADERWWQKPL
ncbi:MAG: GNAT family N-acetyltransferase [Rhodospirillales bacterium]|nr:GNAT family N-acetyltransferase [Rhodospirillales bacterium]